MLILSIFSIGLYLHFFINAPLDPVRLTFRFIIKILTIAIVCNAGIAILTLNIVKKFKIMSTLAYLPSIIITPLIVAFYFLPGFFISIGLNIYLFVKFNPWKKYENKTVVA